MKILLTLGAIAAVTAVILNLGKFSRRLPVSASHLPYINTQLRYQALLLGLVAVSLPVLHSVSPANFSNYFALGKVTADTAGIPWLNIPAGLSWLMLGIVLSSFITLGTGTFIYLQFRNSGYHLKQLGNFLPWVIAFSLTNSFSEEVVYRLGVIIPIAGYVDASQLALLSALAFGLSHFRGMPGGIIGMLMAGFLGWLLAISVMETRGLFWAWLVHFLQDVVIYSAVIMAAAAQSGPAALPVRTPG